MSFAHFRSSQVTLFLFLLAFVSAVPKGRADELPLGNDLDPIKHECGTAGTIEERVKNCDQKRLGARNPDRYWRLVTRTKVGKEMIWKNDPRGESSPSLDIFIGLAEVWLDEANRSLWSKPIIYFVYENTTEDKEGKPFHHFDFKYFWSTIAEAQEHCDNPDKAANGINIPGITFRLPTLEEAQASFESGSGISLPRWNREDTYWYQNTKDEYGFFGDFKNSPTAKFYSVEGIRLGGRYNTPKPRCFAKLK